MSELFVSGKDTRVLLSQAEKDENDGQWYKDRADEYYNRAFTGTTSFDSTNTSIYKRKKVNYDLYNNVVDMKEFEYVCQPFGRGLGNLPANFTNRDIVSGKIKVLLGMEMNMPLSWKVYAVNEEATTRREQAEAQMIRDFVIGEIMKPIRIKNEREARAQFEGRQLTPQEEQQVQKDVEEQTKAMTPDEVRKYMQREHQDPAEVMMQQLFQYVVQAKNVVDKFKEGWKYANLGGEEIYYVGEIRGEPSILPVNDLYFDYDRNTLSRSVQDGEWATYRRRMTPSQVIAEYGDELNEDDIRDIYDFNDNRYAIHDAEFTFSEGGHDDNTIEVAHINFKAPMKIGFLKYYDENGKVQEDIVDESYKINKAYGDISIKWEWIPQAHEVTKIFAAGDEGIYVRKRPVPGQHKDLDNLYECKLSYYGAAYDATNSVPTAPMDRIKGFQYLYNIIIYRLELIMASDEGKVIAANINKVPSKIGTDKWMYFLKANKVAWYDDTQEGNRNAQGGAGNFAQVLDLSLVSDIDKYISLAEYIEKKCGSAIGVTPQMEAQIQAGEAVGNAQQNIMQASHIIRPYFDLHNTIKRDALTALLNLTRVIYSRGEKRKLTYILDDVSYRLLTANIDPEILDMSSYGIFMADSIKADEARNAVIQLSQAAIQNQQATLRDVIKIMRTTDATQAEEILGASEQRMQDNAMAMEQQKLQARREEMELEAAKEDREFEHEKQLIILKEEEERKTELQKQAILTLGFNEDKDMDKDGTPDALEVYKFGVDAQIKASKMALDQKAQSLKEQEFEHKKEVDKEKLEIDRKKANKPTGSSS